MTATPTLRRAARLAVMALAILHSVCAVGSDLDQEITFQIEPQALEGALLEFSRQADIPVAIASGSIRNVEVRGVHGKLAIGAALSLLLKGSGLSYSVVGKTVTVTRITATTHGVALPMMPASSTSRPATRPQ